MDHKPLTQALRRVSPPWSSRQSRQLSFITEYTSDIRHIPGMENIVAYTMSRSNLVPEIESEKISAVNSLPQTFAHIYTVTVPNSPPGINYQKLAAQQQICPAVLQLIVSANLKVVNLPVQNVELLCDVSTGTRYNEKRGFFCPP